MQGPITSNTARPSWQLEERRRPVAAAVVLDPVSGFGPTLRSAAQGLSGAQDRVSHEIRRGDTLSGIAQRRLQELGLPTSGATIAKAVMQLAAANGISDPNRIYAGGRVDLKVLEPGDGALSVAMKTGRAGEAYRGALPDRRWTSVASAASPGAVPTATNQPMATASATVRTAMKTPGGSRPPNFPQLDRTLERAVERGYVGSGERQAVHDRIVELGRRFRFSPDDFATVALMESDGLNPRASNGRCHGILQFCEGPAGGAATVGMQGRAAEIGNRSVLSQLDLVERYLQDSRLGEQGPVSLVDLYLTVLAPTARSEQRPQAALDISGLQAKALHPGGDRSQSITRSSILDGLRGHAQQRLGSVVQPRRGSQLQASQPLRPDSGSLAALPTHDAASDRLRTGLDEPAQMPRKERQG